MRVIGVHAITDAPWALSVERAPVLVFAPGHGWLATDYSVLLEDLASHGYVIIGIAPVGLADVVRLRDGRTVRKTLGEGAAIAEDQAHVHRDVRHLLSRLAALDADVQAPWHGHLDLRRVGAFGHSLGGTTALVAAATDSIVRAAINLDGDAMGTVTEVRPRQPLLFVSSELPTRPTSSVRSSITRCSNGRWTRCSCNPSSGTRSCAWCRQIRLRAERDGVPSRAPRSCCDREPRRQGFAEKN